MFRKSVDALKSFKNYSKKKMGSFKSAPPSYRYIITKKSDKPSKTYEVRKNLGTQLNETTSLDEKINAEPGGTVKPSEINMKKYRNLFKKMTKVGINYIANPLAKKVGAVGQAVYESGRNGTGVVLSPLASKFNSMTGLKTKQMTSNFVKGAEKGMSTKIQELKNAAYNTLSKKGEIAGKKYGGKYISRKTKKRKLYRYH